MSNERESGTKAGCLACVDEGDEGDEASAVVGNERIVSDGAAGVMSE